MTPEFKAQWIEALRSGRYQQARSVLKDDKGAMCCLGVACELIDPKRWNEEPDSLRGYGNEPRLIGYGWNGRSTDSVEEAARALAVPMNKAQKLAFMNDGIQGFLPHTFAQIADYIEKSL